MRRIAILFLSFLLLTNSAQADFTGTGSGFDIPDNVAAGISSEIVVGLSPNEVISDVTIELTGLTHTWIGDLTFQLTGPSGTIDLMWRVGDPEGDCCGDSSDLGGDYLFADGGGDLWAAAAAAGGADIIPGGTYAATGAGGIPSSFAATFGGTLANGIWTLFARDQFGGDAGGIDSWTLNITSTAIPEPSLFVIVGLAGMGLVARRRIAR